MKLIIAIALLVGVALARPQQHLASPRDAVILKYESERDGNGQYEYAYKTSDGQTREEQGVLKNPGTDNEALSVKGSFSYLGPNGVRYSVTYIADENGFRPEGNHLPSSGTPTLGLSSAAPFSISSDLFASLTG